MTTMNDDWEATCAIYEISDSTLAPCCGSDGAELQNGTYEGSLEVQVRVSGLIAVQRVVTTQLEPWDDAANPLFTHKELEDVNSEDTPTFRLRFFFTSHRAGGTSMREEDNGAIEESTLNSVKVELVRTGCMTTFLNPEGGKQEWLGWIQERASRVAEEQGISYSVCEFLENNALDFFGVKSVLSSDRFERAVLICHEPTYNGSSLLRVRRLSQLPSNNKTSAAYDIILANWRDWVTAACPICLEDLPVSQATEILPCHHLFCQGCIGQYAKTVVKDLRLQHENPFRCPIPSCRKPMPLVKCVKGLVSAEDFCLVRIWFENRTWSYSDLLKQCPRKLCRWKGRMQKVHQDSYMVFCDGCGVTWCERCMVRICDAHETCDPSKILELCLRYRYASESTKACYRKKWPWIAAYAAARLNDELALKWAKENAMQCPKCHAGIERIEGCFHMCCAMCATHFCYECGKELFFPYYGTHHCWEEAQTIQFPQFED